MMRPQAGVLDHCTTCKLLLLVSIYLQSCFQDIYMEQNCLPFVPCIETKVAFYCLVVVLGIEGQRS